MKRNLLGLLVVVMMLMITCGNEPPADFYNGTPEDSSAIADLLNTNSALLVSENLFYNTLVAFSLRNMRLEDTDQYFRADSVLTKQHPDSCAMSLSERRYALDYWFAKDTTCTVYIWDTFDLKPLAHWDARWYIHYFWSGDTDIAYDTVIVDSTGGYDEYDAVGVGYRHIFFEPIRDQVFDEETGDTVWAIREPFEWELKRISYGTYNFPAAAQEVPVIAQIILDPDGLGPRSDTIFYSNYDTLYHGHVMNRFRSVDSLLQYDPNDTLKVAIDVYAQVPETLCVFFASCGGVERVALNAAGEGNIAISGSGIVNLWFEAVAQEPYFYVDPRKEYLSNVWLIPVRVGGTP